MNMFSGIKALFGKKPQQQVQLSTNQNMPSNNIFTTEAALVNSYRHRIPSIENYHSPSAFHIEGCERIGSGNLGSDHVANDEGVAPLSIPTLIRIPSARADPNSSGHQLPYLAKPSPQSNSSPLRRRRTAITQLSHPYLFSMQMPSQENVYQVQNLAGAASPGVAEEALSAYPQKRKLSSFQPQHGASLTAQPPSATLPKAEVKKNPRHSASPTSPDPGYWQHLDSIKLEGTDNRGPRPPNTVSDQIRTVLKELQKQKSQSLAVQKSVLERLGIRLPAGDTRTYGDLISLVQNLGDYGLKLEKMSLEIEKRYETMFTDLDFFIDSLKEFITNQLDDHKSELLQRLVAEKTQNKDNFEKLEAQLFDLSSKQKRISEGGYHPQVKNKLAAFRGFFDFSEEFTEEFYAMISSKMLNFNVNNVKEQLSKTLGNVIFDGIKAPKAFPTELMRFFEQLQMKLPTMVPTNIDSGSVISNKIQFPYSLRISPGETLRYTGLSESQNLADGSRKFSLLSWVDNKALVIGTKDHFELCLLNRVFEPYAEDQDTSNYTLGYQLDIKYKSDPYSNGFCPETISNLNIENNRYLMVGGKQSVGCADL
jgi:hypothetical protein